MFSETSEERTGNVSKKNCID